MALEGRILRVAARLDDALDMLSDGGWRLSKATKRLHVLPTMGEVTRAVRLGTDVSVSLFRRDKGNVGTVVRACGLQAELVFFDEEVHRIVLREPRRVVVPGIKRSETPRTEVRPVSLLEFRNEVTHACYAAAKTDEVRRGNAHLMSGPEELFEGLV